MPQINTHKLRRGGTGSGVTWLATGRGGGSKRKREGKTITTQQKKQQSSSAICRRQLRLFIAPCLLFSYCCHNGTLSFKENFWKAQKKRKELRNKITEVKQKKKTWKTKTRRKIV